MNRAAAEHIVRASAAVSDEREIVIVGSHSALIDGAIGELSAFHEAFGYALSTPLWPATDFKMALRVPMRNLE
jgi:hypothetical protein